MGRRPFVRERILEAAFDLFARRGYEAVSTREIAQAAQVGHASMYRHFESKEALGREVYALALEPILVEFAALDRSTPRGCLRACVAAMCRWYDQRPRALALLIFPPHDFTPEALAPDNPRTPRGVLQAALGCDEDTLSVVWGAMTGPLRDRYLRHRTGEMASVAASLARIVERLLDGGDGDAAEKDHG